MGPIGEIDFSIDTRTEYTQWAGSAGIIPMLEQDGVLYGLEEDPLQQIPQYTRWTTINDWNAEFEGFSRRSTAYRDQFTAGFPDFSAAGSPIRFGFAQTLGALLGGQTIEMGYDNLSITVSSATLDGDFNLDQQLDAQDIAVLCSDIRNSTNTDSFDLSGDGIVDLTDLEHWVVVEKKTQFGDADLDGQVDFSDFLALSAAFGEQPADWSQGDFNCSNSVTFADFLKLSQNFGSSTVASVPEPSTPFAILFSISLALSLRKTILPKL